MDESALLAWEFDSRYRVLLGWIWIQPIRTGAGELVYRLPPNVTLVAPPSRTPPGKSLVFMEAGKWIKVADHRGELWFDERDRPVTVERLGDPELWGWNREPVLRSSCGRSAAGSCGA
jgi:hypothetical protein